MPDEVIRCEWAQSEVMTSYHDHEWDAAVHDERSLFEFLILEGAQAGLSWSTILTKRDNYRAAFDDFDPAVVVRYDVERINVLLSNPGIVRNRRKVEAAVSNARAFLEVQAEYGSFDAYIWSFVGGKTRQNAWSCLSDIPALTAESETMSKTLNKRGFKFVGPTICYAFMQAAGLVNDHTIDCFRYQLLGGSAH